MTDTAAGPSRPVPADPTSKDPMSTDPMPACPAPAAVGALVAGAALGDDGRYTLNRLLGAGGMASVWSATDHRLDRDVAVKVISDSLALDPSFVERFAREARLVAGLAHPNVVHVFDYGTDGGRPYLVMERVAGGTLADRVRAGVPVDTLVPLARDLLAALGHVHAAGVVHRDLKPANVLIGEDGRPRLTDFGIAHLADATRATAVGLVFGTERYLAPEMLTGAEANARTDLYSCGVLLAECLGEHPGAAPGPLRTLIGALTRADPEHRPASAAAALALLDTPGEPAREPGPAIVSEKQPAAAGLTRPLTMPALIAAPPPARPVAPAGAIAARFQAGAAAVTGALRRTPPRRRHLALLAVAGASLAALVALAAPATSVAPPAAPSGTASLGQQLDELDAAVDRTRP